MEAVDSIIAAIKDRFEQPSYRVFSNVEQLLLKSIKGEDYQSELKILLEVFGNDIDSFALPAELSILRTLFQNETPLHFDDILSILKDLSANQRALM